MAELVKNMNKAKFDYFLFFDRNFENITQISMFC